MHTDSFIVASKAFSFFCAESQNSSDDSFADNPKKEQSVISRDVYRLTTYTLWCWAMTPIVRTLTKQALLTS